MTIAHFKEALDFCIQAVPSGRPTVRKVLLTAQKLATSSQAVSERNAARNAEEAMRASANWFRQNTPPEKVHYFAQVDAELDLLTGPRRKVVSIDHTGARLECNHLVPGIYPPYGYSHYKSFTKVRRCPHCRVINERDQG